MSQSIPQRLADSVNRFPERTSFSDGKRLLTYRQLSERTDRLAARLVEIGISKGDRVGIYLNRSIETAIAVHGIMKSGAAFVPLDPTSPSARTRFVLDDCGIDVVISDSSQIAGIKDVLSGDVNLSHVIGVEPDQLPCITSSWDDVFENDNSFPAPELNSDDIAYVMYTSGTTGLPKGIVHTHGSGLEYADYSRRLYEVSEEDRLLSHSPLHFDISTMSYLTMPLSGGETVVASDAHILFPTSLAALVEQTKPTIWYSVPLALTQMLTAGAISNHDFSSLRWVLYGGEPFHTKHLRKLISSIPDATFSNVYGPAEVNQCTYYNFNEVDTEMEEVPLGRIWDGAIGIVVDDFDKPITDGIGELLISSGTMMKEYWNQDQLTKKAILKLSDSDGKKTHFYRTGDLVEMKTDGFLYFRGRRDRQVKIRGHRLELDGIEAAILSHPGIGEAAAFCFTDRNEENSLAVSAVNIEGHQVAESELRDFLRERIPRYAVISKIEITDEIPRTRAGKIDHGKLAKNTRRALFT